MAKMRSRGRKKNNVFEWLWLIIMTIVGVGVGGLFLNGTFLTTFILDWLPQAVHTVVGWSLIVSSLAGLLMKVFRV